MSKKLAICFVVFFAIQHLYGQNQNYELPIYYGQFFNDPQINSLGFQQEPINIRLGHRRNGNNFGGIHTTFFSGRFQLAAKKNEGRNELGISFISDKEGFLIRRNRLGASYGRHIKISDKYVFAGGFSAGFYNFSVQSNDITGGLSNYVFDGSFSLALYSDKTKVGFSINQVTNPTFIPLNQTTTLTRHYNIFMSHDFLITEDFRLTPSVLSRYSKATASVFSGFYTGLSLQALFQEHIMGGGSIEFDNGYYFFIGLKEIELLQSRFDLSFSYFVPDTDNERSNVNLYELFLSYKVGSKKNKE